MALNYLRSIDPLLIGQYWVSLYLRSPTFQNWLFDDCWWSAKGWICEFNWSFNRISDRRSLLSLLEQLRQTFSGLHSRASNKSKKSCESNCLTSRIWRLMMRPQSNIELLNMPSNHFEVGSKGPQYYIYHSDTFQYYNRVTVEDDDFETNWCGFLFFIFLLRFFFLISKY